MAYNFFLTFKTSSCNGVFIRIARECFKTNSRIERIESPCKVKNNVVKTFVNILQIVYFRIPLYIDLTRGIKTKGETNMALLKLLFLKHGH